MIVLGLHGGVTINQHDPSAALAIDGELIAICEEERYLRIKSSYGYLPNYSIKACLAEAGIRFEDIDVFVTTGVTYDEADERWADYLRHQFGTRPKIERVHHQEAHLATAFYGSPFDKAICLSLDATGDGSSGMTAIASRENGFQILDDIPARNSLGMFYTLMTRYLGFADLDEYKLMGLATYGENTFDLNPVLKLNGQGWTFENSFMRNEPVVRSPFEPLYSEKLAEFFGQPSRKPGEEITDFHRNLARSTQAHFESCLFELVKSLHERFPEIPNFCFAGGAALNCVANRLILFSGMFENVYVSPVAADRGLGAGCAYLGATRSGDTPAPMTTPYLGSAYSNDDILDELQSNGVAYKTLGDPAQTGAELLADGKIIGWHQGRSEAGARALGNRSILATAGDANMRDKVNARIKYREEFRPFAPSALFESADRFFDTKGLEFPSMSIAVDALPATADQIRAVVHFDGTSRLQTVKPAQNETYHRLIESYGKLTGTPVILNTSFNLNGQPIVETPRDALMTFFGCGLDALIVGDVLIEKDRSASGL